MKKINTQSSQIENKTWSFAEVINHIKTSKTFDTNNPMLFSVDTSTRTDKWESVISILAMGCLFFQEQFIEENHLLPYVAKVYGDNISIKYAIYTDLLMYFFFLVPAIRAGDKATTSENPVKPAVKSESNTNEDIGKNVITFP